MLNQCNFIGRLGSDPKQSFTQGGTKVVDFSIAVDETYKDKSGEKIKKTEWVNIVSFNKLAEIISQYIHKGDQIYVSGRLQRQEWEDKDGIKRNKTVIIISQMEMLGGKKESAGGNDGKRRDEDVPF